MDTLRRVSQDAAVRRRCHRFASMIISKRNEHCLPSSKPYSTSANKSAIIPGSAPALDFQNCHLLIGTQATSTTAFQLFSTTTPTSPSSPPPPANTVQTQETRAKINIHGAVISDGKQQILSHALQGEAMQAQEILEQLETILFASAGTSQEEKADAETMLLESREAVLDAWIAHQNLLITELNGKKPTTKQQIQDIFQAADYAHQALEKTVPFLSRPAMSIYTTQSTVKQSRKNTTNDDTNEADYLDDGSGVDGVTLGKPKNATISTKNAQAMLHRCNAVLRAWARVSRISEGKHHHRGIPQRAMFLLQRMEASTAVKPTTKSYNCVLEAWACSKEHLRGTMAEQLFQRMMVKKQSNNKIKIADGESFCLVIEAWCKSKQKKSSFTATGHLMKYLKRLEKGKEDIQPTPALYHMVMESWTHAEDKNAPLKALSILRLMESAYAQSYCSVPVDETCYRYYLMTSARRPVVPELGPLADQILNKLKDRQIVPDAECYGAAIRTWKNSALNPLFGDSREVSVGRAVALLEELTLAQHRSTLRHVEPTTVHYNDTLEALSASFRPDAVDKAEGLLKTMENSIATYNTGNATNKSDIRPDADSFRWCIEVFSKNKRPDKVELAKSLLGRMSTSYETSVKEKSSDESIAGAYNAFIRVCASARVSENEDSNHQMLREALQAVQEMRSLYDIQPSSETYAELLTVCKNLLTLGNDRSKAIQSIFQTCCEEGLVDERVLFALKIATSADQYTSLVIGKSENVEGTRMVPEEWTRNVGKGRVITAQGRRSAPLSVDGRYTITKAMKEYKMRKLRSKVNQSVLQGGRMKLDPKQRGKPIRIKLEDDSV